VQPVALTVPAFRTVPKKLGAQTVHRLLGAFDIKIIDDDVGTLLRQRLGYAQTHTAPSAADQRHFAVQTEHRFSKELMGA
jgi:hypothetical protein